MPGPEGSAPRGMLVSQHALRQTPPGETATAADGTHPTGMHSCLRVGMLEVLDPTPLLQGTDITIQEPCSLLYTYTH